MHSVSEKQPAIPERSGSDVQDKERNRAHFSLDLSRHGHLSKHVQ